MFQKWCTKNCKTYDIRSLVPPNSVFTVHRACMLEMFTNEFPLSATLCLCRCSGAAKFSVLCTKPTTPFNLVCVFACEYACGFVYACIEYVIVCNTPHFLYTTTQSAISICEMARAARPRHGPSGSGAQRRERFRARGVSICVQTHELARANILPVQERARVCVLANCTY